MRVAETVLASYRLLFANFGAFLRIACFWALLAALTTALGASMEEQRALVRIAPYLLTLLVSTAGSVCVAVVWHRFVILNEPVARLFPTERDVIGPYMVRAAAAIALPLAFLELVNLIYLDAEGDFAADAAAHLGMIAILAAGARLWLALPAAAVGDRSTTFKQSWRATQGRGWAIFAGLLACDLPLTTAIVAVDYLTADYGLYDTESIAAFAVMQVLDLARNAVWTAFISYAYLEFVRPTQMQAEQFS